MPNPNENPHVETSPNGPPNGAFAETPSSHDTPSPETSAPSNDPWSTLRTGAADAARRFQTLGPMQQAGLGAAALAAVGGAAYIGSRAMGMGARTAPATSFFGGGLLDAARRFLGGAPTKPIAKSFGKPFAKPFAAPFAKQVAKPGYGWGKPVGKPGKTR